MVTYAEHGKARDGACDPQLRQLFSTSNDFFIYLALTCAIHVDSLNLPVCWRSLQLQDLYNKLNFNGLLQLCCAAALSTSCDFRSCMLQYYADSRLSFGLYSFCNVQAAMKAHVG